MLFDIRILLSSCSFQWYLRHTDYLLWTKVTVANVIHYFPTTCISLSSILCAGSEIFADCPSVKIRSLEIKPHPEIISCASTAKTVKIHTLKISHYMVYTMCCLNLSSLFWPQQPFPTHLYTQQRV